MKHSFMRVAAYAASFAWLPVVVQGQQPASQPVQGLTVTYTEAGLTIYADQVPLDALLAAIGDRLGIAIVMPPMPDRRVSLAFENESVPAALSRALRGRSYVLSYAQPWTGAIEDSPNHLLILASSTETASQPLNWSGDRSGGNSESAAIKNLSIEDAIAFAQGDEARLIESLSAIAFGSQDAREREQAVFALGDLGTPLGFAVLENALHDPSPIVREAAVVNLSATQSPLVLDSLERALEDEDPGVRESVVLALSELGEARAVLVLEKALSDEDSSVRQAAADALEEALWQE
jgi:hypothetical protein